MDEILKKLAELYGSIDRSRLILFKSSIPTISIAFNAAAEINWLNIYETLALDSKLLIILFEQITKECSENDKILFQDHINQLRIELVASRPSVILPDGRIDPEAFNKNRVYRNKLAFLNRQNLKNNLMSMLNDSETSNVLIIEGKPCSGLTHSQLYIADVINSADKYVLAQILFEDEHENELVTGADIANVISGKLNLKYTIEPNERASLSKFTTFFTKLKGLNDGNVANQKIPVICLDGMYRIPNPNLNRFIKDLLHEAEMHNKFYVVLTLTENNLMRRDWPGRFNGIPSLKINSFTEEDVRSFIHDIYSHYSEQGEYKYTVEEFCDKWIENSELQFDMVEQKLNVTEIGKLCTDWYLGFSNNSKIQLDES